MQEGGINLTLNEDEIKKRMKLKDFSIRLCKVSSHLVEKPINENCAISYNGEMHKVNFHTVSELLDGPSNDYNKFPIKSKRKRVLSRVFKVNRISRRQMRRFSNSKKQRKINQLIEESLNDENTTNSENSESNNLYNEINWEENLDYDASALVDEFAPRVQSPDASTSQSRDLEPVSSNGKSYVVPVGESGVAADTDNAFTVGAMIYVKDFHTSEWNSVKITEVDWEDNELLVHYDDKSRCDEWVSMNSQRISKSKPPVISEEDENDQRVSNIPEIMPISSSERITDTEMYHSEDQLSKKDFRKFKQRNWKKNRQSGTMKSSYSPSKFVIGEKVLAKWSDHRMQKFPAVIKTVVGGGMYDVLFYDGFEKTINEDHLYKTTEEEVAKYQRTNPSEADIFVDMDDNSKEARRQRKKKTFDDYVFARDVKMTRKKGFKPNDGIGLKSKFSLYNKNIDKETNQFPKQVLHPGKKVRRRRKALFGTRRSDSYYKMRMFSSERNTVNNSNSFVSKEGNLANLSNQKNDIDPSISKNDDNDERWNVEIPSNCAPMSITRDDGSVIRSVIVPDKNLPAGWLKHAIRKTEKDWEIFLVSPDNYKFSDREELKRYYAIMRNDGMEPPGSLDFLANYSLLSGLLEQQKNLMAIGPPKIWYKQPSIRSRRGRGKYSTGLIRSVGRVRTLLPKYRTQSALSLSSGTDSEVWKCLKEGCDKKFRKENLLQMHIKHYHSELSSLVRSAPNMVDLACARSENAHAESTKLPQQTIKRILPRSFSGSPGNYQADSDNFESPEQPTTSLQNSRNRERIELLALKRQNALEERRTTIKTILPIRQPDTPLKRSGDSDDNESEDEYIEQKKNGSRIFKPGRFRRRKISTGTRGDDNIDMGSIQSPTFKFTKKKLSSLDKLQITTDSNDSYTEEERVSPSIEVTDDGIVIERLRSEEIINCACGFREEDGLMIQCDICMCWQHGLCSGIETESDVPERYVCNICRNPFRVRSSKKYSYAQHYLTQGKLPSFSFRVRNEEAIKERELMLKRCFEISSGIHEIKNVERSLSAKLSIAEQSDHPKLYLWAKNWDEPHSSELRRETNNGDNDTGDSKPSGPQPETPIDLEECRIRLLDSVENTFSQLENRLTSIQAQIAALESQDPICNSVPDKVIKQTIQMLIRDVETIQKLAAIS